MIEFYSIRQGRTKRSAALNPSRWRQAAAVVLCIAGINGLTPPVKARADTGAEVSIQDATKAHPWKNSLGMKFVPVEGLEVLFSIWDTRSKDYRAFVEKTGYNAGRRWASPGFQQTATHPVVEVSWDDAQAFCRWLTEREHASRRLPQDKVYRLPTDAEWSVAVGLGREEGDSPRAKDGNIKGVYPWGTEWPPPKGAGNYHGEEVKKEDPDDSVIDGYNDGWVHTSPVGTFAANRYGLYDMGGNVWQWCEDRFDETTVVRELQGLCVLRGGSWNDADPDLLLSSSRAVDPPHYRYDFYGFRCVVAPGVRAKASPESE
jgi:hypothetical protein